MTRNVPSPVLTVVDTTLPVAGSIQNEPDDGMLRPVSCCRMTVSADQSRVSRNLTGTEPYRGRNSIVVARRRSVRKPRTNLTDPRVHFPSCFFPRCLREFLPFGDNRAEFMTHA